MQDGTFNGGKRTQRTGYISQASTFIHYTRIYNNHARMYRQIEAKVISPATSNVQSLIQGLLIGHGATAVIQKQKKDPLAYEGVFLLLLYDCCGAVSRNRTCISDCTLLEVGGITFASICLYIRA